MDDLQTEENKTRKPLRVILAEQESANTAKRIFKNDTVLITNENTADRQCALLTVIISTKDRPGTPIGAIHVMAVKNNSDEKLEIIQGIVPRKAPPREGLGELQPINDTLAANSLKPIPPASCLAPGEHDMFIRQHMERYPFQREQYSGSRDVFSVSPSFLADVRSLRWVDPEAQGVVDHFMQAVQHEDLMSKPIEAQRASMQTQLSMSSPSRRIV